MKNKWYAGCDNGITGNIGLLSDDGMVIYKPTPTKKVLNYTKSKQWITRIDGVALFNFLEDIAPNIKMCLLERPFTGKFYKAVVSGARAFEATLIVMELLKVPYQVIDSREWQKALLPKGLRKEELKEASLQVGKRLFPMVDWTKHTDADGLLIAHYSRLKGG